MIKNQILIRVELIEFECKESEVNLFLYFYHPLNLKNLNNETH